MPDEVLCEKLIHRAREGKLITDETGTKKRVGQSAHVPFKCGKPAEKLEISGRSYTAFAQLCKYHQAAAKEEGFTLKVVA